MQSELDAAIAQVYWAWCRVPPSLPLSLPSLLWFVFGVGYVGLLSTTLAPFEALRPTPSPHSPDLRQHPLQRLERELQHLSDRILESITPYARFVKLEEKKITVGEEAISNAQAKIRTIRTKIIK